MRRDFDTRKYSEETYLPEAGTQYKRSGRTHEENPVPREGRSVTKMTSREKYPIHTGGREEFDLLSGRYMKVWQGPQHPGVTGNMSLELVTSGDEIAELKTHVGYLHRGFEKLMERRKWIQNFPLVCRICVPEPDFNEYLYAAATEELCRYCKFLSVPYGSGPSIWKWPGSQVT